MENVSVSWRNHLRQQVTFSTKNNAICQTNWHFYNWSKTYLEINGKSTLSWRILNLFSKLYFISSFITILHRVTMLTKCRKSQINDKVCQKFRSSCQDLPSPVTNNYIVGILMFGFKIVQLQSWSWASIHYTARHLSNRERDFPRPQVCWLTWFEFWMALEYHLKVCQAWSAVRF